MLKTGWNIAHQIMGRGVGRGLERRGLGEIEHAGIDEKSYRKGHSYVSVVNDLEGNRALKVAEGRTAQSADSLWLTLGAGVRATVKAVAMDLWEPSMKCTRENVPGALVVHDRFRIAAYLGKAVDQVRRAEHKELLAAGDERLKGSRQPWLSNRENVTDARSMAFEKLLKMDLKRAQAWAMKESMRHFWDYGYAGNAKRFFEGWLDRVRQVGEAPMKKVAEMINSHLPEGLNYVRCRISNAVSEGLSKIQSIKAMARGFRGFKNYRIRI